MKRYDYRYYCDGIETDIKRQVRNRSYQKNTKYKDGYKSSAFFIDIDVLDSNLLQELYK